MNSKIKTVLLSSIFSILAGIAASAAPLSANAQATHDCTDGCYIITCSSGGDCTVWRCSGGSGCIQVGSFRSMSNVKGTILGSGQASATHAKKPVVTSIAYATVCPSDKRCDLYRLTASKATLVGSFGNINGAIKAQKAKDQKYDLG